MLARLSLRTRILLWVSLAIALPMALLLSAAFHYGQLIYATEARQDVFGALERTTAALERRLLVEHDLVNALAQVPALQAFLPSLAALRQGQVDPDHERRAAALIRFIQTFQGIRRSLGTVRVLDYRGDTLVKIREGHSSPPVIDNLDAIPVIENGSENPAFRAALKGLRTRDAGSLASPPGFDGLGAVLNTALPLFYHGQVVGYLVIGAPLEPLDRTLDIAARPRGAQLLVAEINPDEPARNGLVLYADAPPTRLAALEPRGRLQEVAPSLLNEGFARSEGQIETEDGSSWYFRQHSPYPDRLSSWTVAYHLDRRHLNAPFSHSAFVIWATLAIALSLGVLLAQLVARKVTGPVSQLAQRLGAYAQGAQSGRLALTGPAELHAAHAAFNQMADTLDRLAAERDQAQRAALQNAKLTAVGQLAAGLAHELSNPLANIFSLTKLVQRHLPADQEQPRQDLDNIRAEAERASRIIRGLLDFARRGGSHSTAFGLAAWVQESLDLVRRMAEQHDIALQTGPAVAGQLCGDRGLLQQALVNVLINAVQAAPAQSRIELTVERNSDWVEIRVRDHGPGIPPEIAERVFDPFFTTKAEGEGTGLGLSIAIGIIERHKGRLTLENAPGGGALARLWLPAPDPAGAPPTEVQ